MKLCLLDTGGRISEIQRRLTSPGGYDFYKPLQRAVRAHCSGQQELVNDILGSPVNDNERRYNQEAFEKFLAKFGGVRSLNSIESPKALEFPDAGISITTNPLFEVTKQGNLQIYSLWATQKPPMTQRYGAVACHILRRAYSSTSLGNGSFLFYDLNNSRSYSERQITNNTELILLADVNSIGTLVRNL